MKTHAFVVGRLDPIRSIGDPKKGLFAIDLQIENCHHLDEVRLGFRAPERVRRAHVKGVVNADVCRLTLPARIVKQLGLRVTGKIGVRGRHGRITVRKTAYGASITLLGREGTFTAIIDPDCETAVVGWFVLQELDLLADYNHKRLVRRDPRYRIVEL
jgi:hypothetical protein